MPCNAYHNNSTGSTFVTALNNFCRDNFVNSTYASSATSVSGNSASNGTAGTLNSAGMLATGTTNGSHTSAYYWLAAAYDGGSARVYCVRGNGGVSSNYDLAFGVRPLVTLKAGVKTNNAKDTSYLGQTCWAVK